MANDYHFFTNWRVRGTVKEVIDILRDATDLPRWWPSVYLEVKELAPGDENGIGKEIALYTKGWLPYTLRWQFTVSEANTNSFKLVAQGDFVGYGIWTFKQDGEWVEVIYEWKITAEKPLLRTLTPILRPIFAANHKWAMARGLESLELELRRIRSTTAGERDAVPAPPPATTTSPVPLMLVTSGALVGIVVIARAVLSR
jgi:hypothetical protein